MKLLGVMFACIVCLALLMIMGGAAQHDVGNDEDGVTVQVDLGMDSAVVLDQQVEAVVLPDAEPKPEDVVRLLCFSVLNSSEHMNYLDKCTGVNSVDIANDKTGELLLWRGVNFASAAGPIHRWIRG